MCTCKADKNYNEMKVHIIFISIGSNTDLQAIVRSSISNTQVYTYLSHKWDSTDQVGTSLSDLLDSQRKDSL